MDKTYYYGIVENPFRAALQALMNIDVVPDYVKGFSCSDLSEKDNDALQSWVCENMPDALHWSTGIGVIEAAELIVREAVSNGNIAPPPKINEFQVEIKSEMIGKDRYFAAIVHDPPMAGTGLGWCEALGDMVQRNSAHFGPLEIPYSLLNDELLGKEVFNHLKKFNIKSIKFNS